MAGSQIARVDLIRSVPFGSISGTYVALGSALTHVTRLICITNQTAGNLFFAFTSGNTPASDGSADNLFIPAGGFKLFDLGTNREETNTTFALSLGTQIFVRQSTAPVSGAVYLESIYGQGE